jgi:DNA recombination protein RmuC
MIEIVLILGLLVVIGLQVVALLKARPDAAIDKRLTTLEAALERGLERLGREFREESGRNRGEFAERFEALRKTVDDKLREALADARVGREETANALRRFGEAQGEQLGRLGLSNEQKLEQLRLALHERLQAIQRDNAAKLEEMRQTVDEKLHATLEQRLGESFKLVSDRLEQVHRGLGEMQTLAAGVGDLKRVLTNVKTRGTWGEVQLEALLEQILTAEQYGKNVATRPGSNDRVEFAIKLPGQGVGGDERPVWLPLDAKFPVEDYQKLLDAQDRVDPPAVDAAAKALEARIRDEAKTIREKYVEPPYTTDFAILYLPIESLYAEALRRPGLAEALQRDFRVTLAGPTTLAAMLNSLQMGFRTLAIEKRSSEVWQVLGAVKTEFGKFGEALAHTKKKLQEATNSIDKAEVRTRAVSRRLKEVEALPATEASDLLGAAGAWTADDDVEAS